MIEIERYRLFLVGSQSLKTQSLHGSFSIVLIPQFTLEQWKYYCVNFSFWLQLGSVERLSFFGISMDSEHLGPRKMFYIESCPLLGMSFIGGGGVLFLFACGS